MKLLHYQVLRYMPDRVSGEFVNLGVVVFDPAAKDFDFEFRTRTIRLQRLFPEADANFVRKSLLDIQRRLKFQYMAPKCEVFTDDKISISTITSSALPVDDSALFFTESQSVFDLNVKIATADLYQRLVAAHTDKTAEKRPLPDEQVWAAKYRKYFQQRQFFNELKADVVETAHDEFKFGHTIQNGVLHCFQPINFALTSDAIKEKVYATDGRYRELETANKILQVYLLANMPADQKLQQLIRDKFSQFKVGQSQVQLVEENQVNQVLDKVEAALH